MSARAVLSFLTCVISAVYSMFVRRGRSHRRQVASFSFYFDLLFSTCVALVLACLSYAQALYDVRVLFLESSTAAIHVWATVLDHLTAHPAARPSALPRPACAAAAPPTQID